MDQWYWLDISTEVGRKSYAVQISLNMICALCAKAARAKKYIHYTKYMYRYKEKAKTLYVGMLFKYDRFHLSFFLIFDK